MNIFFYSDNTEQSALWLDDKRKNKMILEAGQMLSTAICLNDFDNLIDRSSIYKPTHVNHPSNVWVRESRANFNWCFGWMAHLNYQRVGLGDKRTHASWSKLADQIAKFHGKGWFPSEELTPFANCAASKAHGLDFKHLPVHDAYRAYHTAKWKNETPTWSCGERPPWYT